MNKMKKMKKIILLYVLLNLPIIFSFTGINNSILTIKFNRVHFNINVFDFILFAIFILILFIMIGVVFYKYSKN